MTVGSYAPAQAEYGLKNHLPHSMDPSCRNAPSDEPAPRHGNYRLQLRGPRGRRTVTQDEEDEYTADELALMHGYPAVPAGLARRRM